MAIHRDIVLADGARLTVRSIVRTDKALLVALFDSLSDESRRRRFLGPKRSLTPGEVEYLTDVDHSRHEALLAVDPETGAIVGVARYAAWHDDPQAADVAFAVRDSWHGRGVGRELGRRLVAAARARGFTRLTASTLPENRPARALLRGLGFAVRRLADGVLDLETAIAPRALAA